MSREGRERERRKERKKERERRVRELDIDVGMRELAMNHRMNGARCIVGHREYFSSVCYIEGLLVYRQQS